MSVEYTRDYSDHVLLDNKNKYSEIFKVYPAEPQDVHRGDVILLKTACGRFELFMALDDASMDENNKGALHLTKFAEVDFVPEVPLN